MWADINNDGLLDLFVGNENGPQPALSQQRRRNVQRHFACRRHRQDGVHESGVAADYDNDGYLDLYVSNYAGQQFLYHNNHDRTFTEVAQQAGVLGPWISFPAWFFDYDNDGWPDLFVTSYFVSVEETVQTYLGLPHNAV